MYSLLVSTLRQSVRLCVQACFSLLQDSATFKRTFCLSTLASSRPEHCYLVYTCRLLSLVQHILLHMPFYTTSTPQPCPREHHDRCNKGCQCGSVRLRFLGRQLRGTTPWLWNNLEERLCRHGRDIRCSIESLRLLGRQPRETTPLPWRNPASPPRRNDNSCRC